MSSHPQVDPQRADRIIKAVRRSQLAGLIIAVLIVVGLFVALMNRWEPNVIVPLVLLILAALTVYPIAWMDTSKRWIVTVLLLMSILSAISAGLGLYGGLGTGWPNTVAIAGLVAAAAAMILSAQSRTALARQVASEDELERADAPAKEGEERRARRRAR
ncbi:hypothetical protein [Corynebacterium guangdongense]|uniref:Neutral ceramidase superfamily lipid hydrolase n=1 Tax=Corynebacterium guangdongense TaxID=1783348 RepID=A0ABU1ZVP7_9CORY|nr:hypothetical protein [Corynebacterium guangdongense]MDR7328438.1 putative neutral ceramidase superfamily lipid hydrolase [Corynebacterium guangdongense]WJZ17015.1 hypothetical protein CGUA_02075 [Corynebacterium guangdongense]